MTIELINNQFNILKYLRQINGLSQESLAEKTGLNSMDICRIENNNYNCHLDKILRLSKYFGVDIETLCFNKIDEAAKTLKNPVVKTYNMQKRFHKRNLKGEKTGRKGEEYDYELEKANLKGTLYENAIDPNYADKDDAHYDMLSFDENGEPIIIEVKTTERGSQTPFFMSVAEINKAKKCIENEEKYRVDRIYKISNKKKRGRKLITAEELFRDYDFIPHTYKILHKGEG